MQAHTQIRPHYDENQKTGQQVERDRDRLRRRRGIETGRSDAAGRQQNGPQRRGGSEDPFPRVVDETLTCGQVPCVAEGDEGIVRDEARTASCQQRGERQGQQQGRQHPLQQAHGSRAPAITRALGVTTSGLLLH